MGADFYMNPPQEQIVPLDVRVREVLDENREYRRMNVQLQTKIQELEEELRLIRSTITLLKGE